MRLTGALLTFLLLANFSAGCSAAPERKAPGAAGGETTARDTEAKEMVVERIAEGQSGPAERRVVVAGSAAGLAGVAGLEIPDSGEGLYVSVHAGERPTGGYRVALSDAGGGDLRVTLREPGRGDIVTQALTQPYAVAVVRGERGKVPADELRFVDAEGEPLGWPVHRVGAAPK